MKKLKLSALQLNAKEILTREQLKNVLGGSGSGGLGGNGSCWIHPSDQNGNPVGEPYAIVTSSGCPGASSEGNQACLNLIGTQGNGVYHCSYNCGC